MQLDESDFARHDGTIAVAGTDSRTDTAFPVSDAAHALLRLGRLMLVSGAAIEHVQKSVVALAQRLGYEAHLLVFAEGLLLTLLNKKEFHTKLGPSIAREATNMKALSELDDIVCRGLKAPPTPEQIEQDLNTIERGSRYPEWLVALGLGLTAASLARLFGGGAAVVLVSGLVGALSSVLRRRLEIYAINPIASTAMLALATGMAGALILKAIPNTSPVACLVAAGTILMPGVMLINGMRDALGHHVSAGLSRLTLGTAIVMSIVVGLLVAAVVTGETLSVGHRLPRPSIRDEVLFSALAGTGLAIAFNVPLRAAWACIACAVVGHGMRLVLLQLDMSLATGTFVGAFTAAWLASIFSQRASVPAIAFIFPGIVTLLPTPEAFRAALGALDIAHAGANASTELIGATIALGVTAILVIASIAIGLSLALSTYPVVLGSYASRVRTRSLVLDSQEGGRKN